MAKQYIVAVVRTAKTLTIIRKSAWDNGKIFGTFFDLNYTVQIRLRPTTTPASFLSTSMRLPSLHLPVVGS